MLKKQTISSGMSSLTELNKIKLFHTLKRVPAEVAENMEEAVVSQLASLMVRFFARVGLLVKVITL